MELRYWREGGLLIEILVVEDDAMVATAIREAFRTDDHMAIHAVPSLQEAFIHLGRADMVLLDLNLTDSQGHDTLIRLRGKAPTVPLIVISAIERPEVRIQSLHAGADDYLVKPFSLEELKARIAAVARRTLNLQSARPVGFLWQRLARQVSWQNHVLELTPLEYEVFRTLAETPGVALSRPDILRRVIGPNFYGYDRVVDVHIGHLRKKLEAGGPDIIQTVRAYGYRWNPEIPVEVRDE